MEKIKFDPSQYKLDCYPAVSIANITLERFVMESKRLACKLYVPTTDNSLQAEFYWIDSIDDLKCYLEGKHEGYKMAIGKTENSSVTDIALICMQRYLPSHSDVFLPGILYNISTAKDRDQYDKIFKSIADAMGCR